jgi:transcriptional regulator with XRE-family HTH domain
MMPKTFGARLRQRREQRQIALTTIAEQTKIGLPLLEGLERDDISHWPSGIFRRAFIRGYALAIGLDPDATVREFLELYPDPVEATALPTAPPPDNFLTRLGLWPARKRPAVEDAPTPAPPPAPGAAPVADLVEDPVSVSAPDPVPEPVPAPMPPLAPALEASQAPDLLALARLCTEFGRVEGTREAAPLLKEAARILNAVGLIIWVWDSKTSALRPALGYGYPDKMLAQLPGVARDTDNATAASFREAGPRVVRGSELASGALVVPLMTASGCAGVLAIELPHGREQQDSTLAIATIFAAQVARWIRTARPARTAGRRPATTAQQQPASNASARAVVQ